MTTLKLWIPRSIPPASFTESRHSPDLTTDGPVRRLIAEAAILGVEVEVDPRVSPVGEA